MEDKKREVGEDATKYGEFISSYFAWVPLPEQKDKVQELENMTKNQNNKKKWYIMRINKKVIDKWLKIDFI